MRPRPHPPDPKVEYFIDCAVQAGELDAGTGFALRLYDRDADVLPIIAPRPDERSSIDRRTRKCLELCALADDLMTALPPERRAGLIRAGLMHVVDEMVSLAETFSNWAIDDEIDGGDLLPFRDRLRSKNGVPFKRSMRRLCAPRFIRRYVKGHTDEVAHFRALSEVSVARARRWGAAHDPGIMADWRLQIARKMAVESRRSRADVRAERKMIVRSYNVAVSVLGEDMVRAFLRGEEVRIVGREAALAVRKRGNLADRGHGSLSVGLATRDGTMLADLCTFIEDTPTLDQLCGFALWMRAGEERQVIATANVIEATPEGRKHPLLIEKPRRSLEEMVDELDPKTANAIAHIIGNPRKPFRRQLSYEETRARNDAYWERTKGQWIEAMLANVVGCRNEPIFKAAQVL